MFQCLLPQQGKPATKQKQTGEEARLQTRHFFFGAGELDRGEKNEQKKELLSE